MLETRRAEFHHASTAVFKGIIMEQATPLGTAQKDCQGDEKDCWDGIVKRLVHNRTSEVEYDVKDGKCCSLGILGIK